MPGSASFRTLFGLSAALAITACGGDGGTEPDDDGDASISVTGALTESFDATAVFAESGGMWILSLNGGAADGEVLIIGEGTRPAAGTYAIGGEGSLFGAVYTPPSSTSGYVADEGSLIIQESSSAEVEGGFNFTHMTEAGPIFVAGSFRAVRP